MSMRVKEVADLVGISVRTLHYYDEIGLLTPDNVTNSRYRLYSDKNLETLQQILFYRELGFSLQKIKQMIQSPTFDRRAALMEQRHMLLEKRNRLDDMIKTIDKTIQHEKGVIQMCNKEKFAFNFRNNPYETEARQHWGDKVVDKSKSELANMSKGALDSLEETMNSIYRKLATLRHSSPASPEAQEAIEEWYNFLNHNFGHHYSLDAFKQLGQMYVDDKRFTKNIDQFGDGLAQFMCDAMAIYSDRQQE